jgi:hypothetical protein
MEAGKQTTGREERTRERQSAAVLQAGGPLVNWSRLNPNKGIFSRPQSLSIRAYSRKIFLPFFLLKILMFVQGLGQLLEPPFF